VRTITSLNRLLDVLPVFRADRRVQVVFTIIAGSQFHDGLAELIRRAGFRLIPWTQALHVSFDLAMSASDKGDLPAISAPLLLLPHGAGYHRRTTDTTQHAGHAISGLAATVFDDDKLLTRTTVVVAHPTQLNELRLVSEVAARNAVVAGDPCLDRILSSLHRRVRYRTALGATAKQVVVVNSTWGPASLLGTNPVLPERLLAELPLDEYRVALVLHPNVWTRHGDAEVRRWLADALDAGLVLIPPDEGWRAALIAADVVISDHGSVTCYAAALGAPVLIAADGGAEVVPGSPMETLLTALPRLRPAEPLAVQLKHLLDNHDSERVTALTKPVFARRHESMTRLRTTLYHQLRLPVLGRVASAVPIPVPDVRRQAPAALAVHVTLARPTEDHVDVAVRRMPAAVSERWADSPDPMHLVAYPDEADMRASETAAVLVASAEAATLGLARRWIRTAFANFPGARIVAAAAPERIVLGLRPSLEVHVLPRTGDEDPAAWASAVYACLIAGAQLSRIRRVSLRLGPLRATANLIVWNGQGHD
jgi:hypothetical protein